MPTASEAATQEATYRRAVTGGGAGVASTDIQVAMFSGYRADAKAHATVRTLSATARALRLLAARGHAVTDSTLEQWDASAPIQAASKVLASWGVTRL
eukprot:1389675-Alexandrium_andersonii.AAC.1